MNTSKGRLGKEDLEALREATCHLTTEQLVDAIGDRYFATYIFLFGNVAEGVTEDTVPEINITCKMTHDEARISVLKDVRDNANKWLREEPA